MFYVLVLVISFGREGSMSTIPGYSDREACNSAGAAFIVMVKPEQNPRFYCFQSPERNGSR